MATKKVGELIREARTAAGFTQEKLAKAAGEGLTGGDIGKCERGTADLTTAQLRSIAKACGMTQTSLVNAPKNLSAAAARKGIAKASAGKASSAKTTSARTESGKKVQKPAAGKASSGSTAGKAGAKGSKAKAAVPASAGISMKVTATEQKLIEAYRGASSDMKKVAMKVLKGDYGDQVTGLLNMVGGGSASSGAADGISDAISSLLGGLLGGK